MTANPEHLAQLLLGVEAFNQWRAEHPRKALNLAGSFLSRASLGQVNFEGVNLSEANLSGADLSGAKLGGANLTKANLSGANLREGDLTSAELMCADLSSANLSVAKLVGADLRVADLTETDFSGADLTGALLQRARLVSTKMKAATLTGCSVYGISAWDLDLDGTVQSNLIITPEHEPIIQVDNLEVAQFIYLLLNNQKIRNVIDTITSKVALILGRFTEERKAVLEAIRDELRKRDYLPVLFDFEKPSSQTTEETISTLAHMARFVIADLTDAKSVLQELRAIVPNSPSVPIQPVLLASQEEPGMFDFFRKSPWVLEPVRYTDQKLLMVVLDETVIAPAERARALAAM